MLHPHHLQLIVFACSLWSACNSPGPIDQITSTAMAGSKPIAAALVMVGLVVAMAMVAEAGGVCDPNALYPCLPAIHGAHPPAPSRQCCRVVQTVDKTCMCNQLKSSSFPAQMVHNGLQLPNKCGRTDLRGFRCGRQCLIPSHPITMCYHPWSGFP